MKKHYWLWGSLIFVALFIVSGVNTVPQLDEKVSAAWGQVENQYQRRSDLVPNLVRTVKGYAAHERATLEAVVTARANATKVTLDVSQLGDAAAMTKLEKAQGELSTALSRLLMVTENYPALKADQNFLALQSQLEGTENRISVARKDYIDAVQSYNTTIRTFPGVIWAKIYGAAVKPHFSAVEGAEAVPNVAF